LQPDPPLLELDTFSGWKQPGVIDEQGLVGLALDPKFDDNNYVYLHWTYRVDSSTNQTARQIARFTLVDDQLTDKKVLVDGIPGAKQHVGGPLEFGPDGKLYITGGEAGKQKEAQDPESPLGKILRINSDGTIPEDNPFLGTPYFTMGHRNVFGIGFHPVTGVPYITENGPESKDEVNILYAGKNYGWPEVLGVSDDPAFISPIWDSGQGTIAPTELEFYTGDKYPPELVNDLFFLAYNPRSLERIELEGPGYDKMLSHHSYQLPLTGMGSYTDLELGPDGYFYASDFRSISKIIFEYANVTTKIEIDQPSSTTTGTPTPITARILDYFGKPVVN
ncbi:MAG: PQQ-dependent sugar dehydrogenase, partial [Nitrososphaerales archaeon]